MLRGLMQALFVSRSRLAPLWAILLSAVWLVGPAMAQTPAVSEGAQIEVRAVKFGQVRAPASGDTWNEAVVDLGIVPATGDGAYSRWADSVRVTLSISVRRRDGEFEFFRASAEAVSLEAGRAVFRYYLPPEIVRREQLGSSEPYAWLVEIAVKGKPLPPTARHLSANLATAEALRSFKDRVARTATVNDGVLVPQVDSPFASAYAGETPSFVRR